MSDSNYAKRLVTVLSVAFNEEDCIEELIKRLRNVFDTESNYSWNAILVDNGSVDGTWEIIKQANYLDSRFSGLRLSRNFQMDGGLLAGMEEVNGDACVLMAADLQDPPELISAFLREWESGSENIYAVIKSRRHSSFMRRINSFLFYLIASRVSAGVIARNVSDFRLVDKKVYQTVREMQERNRFLRGLFAWVGFKTKSVEIDRPARHAGESKAHTAKVLALAIKGILAHSYVPIRAISIFGFGMAFVSLVSLVFLLISWINYGVPFQGFGTLAALTLLSFTFLSLMLGIIGEYIALIYEETKARPNFIVSERIR